MSADLGQARDRWPPGWGEATRAGLWGCVAGWGVTARNLLIARRFAVDIGCERTIAPTPAPGRARVCLGVVAALAADVSRAGRIGARLPRPSARRARPPYRKIRCARARTDALDRTVDRV